jgi:glycolate oxidase iron-sulfur subunit
MDSPRGRLYLMRAAAEGRSNLTPTLARHLDLCLGCRACETACPSGVPFGRLLEATRGQLVRRGVRGAGTEVRARDFALGVFPHPRRLRALIGALGLYQRSGLRSLVRTLGLLAPFPKLRAMESALPALPAHRPPLREITPAVGARRGRVALLTGCVQRFFYPDVNADTARLLAAGGYEVVAPRGQGCCGALHLHAGRIEEFRAMARALVAALDPGTDLVVTSSAGCGSALKEYGHWLGDAGAGAFAAKVRDIAEVLVDCDLPLRELRATVAYHDPCHLAHGQRIRAEPRELLRRIPGLALRELADGELCCGSAGVYSLVEPGIAAALGRAKAERIRDTGARIVATGNPGCMMQIAQHCRELGADVEVVHPVTLLARALDAPASAGRTPGHP